MTLPDGTPLRVGLRVVDAWLAWLASIGEGRVEEIHAGPDRCVVAYPCVTKVYSADEAKALRAVKA